eukprot:SAG22_NODE_1161_length_5307_cov_55.889593_2_plen_80_part_00
MITAFKREDRCLTVLLKYVPLPAYMADWVTPVSRCIATLVPLYSSSIPPPPVETSVPPAATQAAMAAAESRVTCGVEMT